MKATKEELKSISKAIYKHYSINEDDLYRVILERKDITVSIDVISGEVNRSQFQSPLSKLQNNKNLIITPHIAGATIDSQTKAAIIASNLVRKNLSAC